MVRQLEPDIVLLDINMPQVTGLEILESMRRDQDLMMIPTVILTAANDPETKLQALRLGASDFLAKPVDPSELMLRVENVLAVKAYQDHLAKHSERLEQQVRLRTAELVRSRQEAIHCLARAGEYRDDDTGHHVTRVGRYSALIAAELGFPEQAVELIEQAAQLHDVGKIGIPDSILHKPGKLDPQEFESGARTLRNRSSDHQSTQSRRVDSFKVTHLGRYANRGSDELSRVAAGCCDCCKPP